MAREITPKVEKTGYDLIFLFLVNLFGDLS